VLSWSLLEAMAAGCLVVGSRTAPVEEVMRDGENGLLIDFFSPEAIAERVDHALTHQTDLAPLRERARQSVVERFDLRRICLPAQLKLINGVRSHFPDKTAKPALTPTPARAVSG
jgi:glycosyltransferase involved in cell wall biosynthesis